MLGFVTTKEEALLLRAYGFEPIECVFGDESVVGPLGMDHHAQHSKEPPVSLKAARLALSEGFIPVFNFAVSGLFDADAVSAIGYLNKTIPPDMEVAKAIALLDTEPIGIDRTKMPFVRIPAFEYMTRNLERNVVGYAMALEIAKEVFHPNMSPEYLHMGRTYEKRRLKDIPHQMMHTNKHFGFAVTDGVIDDHFNFAPIIVQYRPGDKRVSIKGLTELGSKRMKQPSVYNLFGENGLEEIAPKLSHTFNMGFAGRPHVLASQKGRDIQYSFARGIYNQLIKFYG